MSWRCGFGSGLERGLTRRSLRLSSDLGVGTASGRSLARAEGLGADAGLWRRRLHLGPSP